MLVPMQAVMGPIELVLEPGLMPQLKLEPQPELVLVLKLRLEPEPGSELGLAESAPPGQVNEKHRTTRTKAYLKQRVEIRQIRASTCKNLHFQKFQCLASGDSYQFLGGQCIYL